MLDERHLDIVQKPDDPSLYTLGRIHNHNVVIVCLPAGQTGASSAAVVTGQMRYQFPSIQHTFLVGVVGGVPGDNAAVRLGDVVISQSHMGHGGVVQYDFGKSTLSGFKRTGFVNAPPTPPTQPLVKEKQGSAEADGFLRGILCDLQASPASPAV